MIMYLSDFAQHDGTVAVACQQPSTIIMAVADSRRHPTHDFVNSYRDPLPTSDTGSHSDIGQGDYDSEEIASSLIWEHEVRS